MSQPRSTSPVASTSTAHVIAPGPSPSTSQVPIMVASTRPQVQSTRATGSSNSHAGSRSSTSRSSGAPTSHMESTITRLLVATKQLLEGLAKWSKGEISEEAISEIYVKLGNDFNVACAAFARENIQMNELLSVPSDLRVCLETCLSEPPSQATLERHLPKVRQIIIGLLHGLREKQRLYRDGAASRRQRERDARGSQSSRQGSISEARQSNNAATASALSKDPLTPNTASRSRDELRKFVTQAQATSAAGPGTATQRASVPNPQPVTHASSSSLSARPVASSSSDPSLQSSSSPALEGRHDDSTTATERRSLSRSNSAREERTQFQGTEVLPSQSQNDGGLPNGRSHRSSGSMRESSRLSRNTLDSVDTFYSSRPVLHQTRSTGSIMSVSGSPRNSIERRNASPPPPPIRQALEEPIHALPSTSLPSGRPDSVLSMTPGINEDGPSNTAAAAAQLESLEALKASDNLSRRASKRYSAYAISKMTMSGSSSSTTLSGMASSPLRGNHGDEGSGHASSSRKIASTRGSISGQGSSPLAASPRRVKSEYGRSSTLTSSHHAPPLPPLPANLSGPDSHGFFGSIPEEDPNTPRAQQGSDGTVPVDAASSLPPVLPLPPTPIKDDSMRMMMSPPLVGAQTPRRAYDNPLSNTATRSPASGVAEIPLPAPPSSSNQIGYDPVRTVTASSTDDFVSAAAEFPTTVFLQIGRDVKKVSLGDHEQQPLMLATIRQLFVERFGYNPGQVDFPAVYIRDRDAGIDYELEDMGDVKNSSVLSLNIDTVEQVKQHIDQGLSALSQEMKELRSTMSAMRRTSVTAHQLFTPEHASAGGMVHNSASSPRPTERQFQDAAQRVVKMRKLGSTPNLALASPPLEPSPAEIPAITESTESDKVAVEPEVAPAVTGGEAVETSPTQSVSGDAFTAQIVGTLKTQHQEVQNLRREIGIIRQVYLDFAQTTKDMISNVRVQSSHVHRLASTKITTDRTFVEAGTTKLDSDSTDLVVKVDDLTDTIDQLRADTVRGIRAKPSQLSEMGLTITRLSKTREDLMSWLTTVKPKWQESWSNELAKVLGEQERVQNQEALLVELGDDLNDVRGVLKNLEVVSKQAARGSGAGGRPSRELNVGRDRTSVDGLGAGSDVGGGPNGSGLANVLYEVQGLRPDPARRLEAIARAEKQRELENANRTDEFELELSGFVKEGKLKKSGGIEETERLRQARSEATIKAMFAGV